MPIISLGFPPLRLTVSISADGDFIAALISDQTWPAGVEIVLRLSGGSIGEVVWDATVIGNRAEWNVPMVEVQEVVTAGVATARLMYTNQDGAEILWAKGDVNVY